MSSAEPDRSHRPLKIDLDELIDAMTWSNEETRAYLDLRTGAIGIVGYETMSAIEDGDEEDLPEWQKPELELAREVAADDENFVALPRIEPGEQYEIMTDFVRQLGDERARERLADALDRPKPFRRFKDALAELGSVRERWFSFERERHQELASRWLESIGVKPI